MSKSIPGVKWVEIPSLQTRFAIVTSKRGWTLEMDRLKVAHHHRAAYINQCAVAQVTTMENIRTGHELCYLCVSPSILLEFPMSEALECIAHECVHVWQFVENRIGERNASKEFEAYTIGFIYKQVLDVVLPKMRKAAGRM